MATIRKEFEAAAPPDQVWAAFRDFGAVHRRLAPGFVADTKLEEGARLVVFANGVTARERLVTIDDSERRLVYAIESAPFSHHNASFQVLETESGASRVLWTADLLPDEIADQIEAMMEQGCSVMQRTLSQRQA